MKKNFEEPKIEIIEIVDIIVTSPEDTQHGAGANDPSGYADPGHGW